ncbi:hypothetical protein [Catenovulum maritimum]|uniref:Lipoprotein n=1 Tax=Catenovulum maritimum TaxID=1513271 RepID=A0A0J8GZB6_9ALTE|nr:hypothetical protein [Catenovulum maritimum]KMT66063.1 hypothetical protein XM47_06350 [Catenovulum maritimum]
MQHLLKRNSLFLILLLNGLSACSDSDSARKQINYSFVAEDAALIGLDVSDNAGNQATESSPGTYSFDAGVVPQPPVTFVTRNTDSEPFNSFQDLDASGDLSEADIAYNVGFSLKFIPQINPDEAGITSVFANPITALIPAQGTTGGLGGLNLSEVNSALSGGVKNADPVLQTKLQKIAAKITAVQEAIVASTGQKASKTNLTSINLLDRFNLSSDTLTDDTKLNQLVDSALDSSGLSTESIQVVKATATQVGTNINKATSPTKGNLFESAIKLVQTEIKQTTTVAQVSSLISETKLLTALTQVVSGIDLAETVASSGGKEAFVASLLLVPPMDANGDIFPQGNDVIQRGMSDFALSLNKTSNVITIADNGAYFSGAGVQLSYSDTSKAYGGISGNDAYAISLNAIDLVGVEGYSLSQLRLISFCIDYDTSTQTCGVNNQGQQSYALATKAEICSAYDNQPLNESILQSINANYGDSCSTSNN